MEETEFESNFAFDRRKTRRSVPSEKLETPLRDQLNRCLNATAGGQSFFLLHQVFRDCLYRLPTNQNVMRYVPNGNF